MTGRAFMARDFKLVLLGQENAGKSCLVDRFVHDIFEHASAVATVGASYAAKKLRTSSGEIVFQLWDTAGAERFESLSRLYYSGAHAALVCVDPTNSTSFAKTQFWVKELKVHQPSCRCYIVLCKCDLLEIPPAELPPRPAHNSQLLDSQPRQFAYPPASPAQEGSSPEPECSKLTKNLQTEPRDTAAVGVTESKGQGSAELQSSGHITQPGASTRSPFDRKYSGSNEALTDRNAESDGPVGPDSGQESTTSTPLKLPGSKRKAVSDAQLQAVAASVDAKIAATSARTGQGVQELFQLIADDLAGSPAQDLDKAELLPAQTPCATPRHTAVPVSMRESTPVMSNRRKGFTRTTRNQCCQ